MRSKILIGVLAAITIAADPGIGEAQNGVAEPTVIYRREIFEYARNGRPDPFRSLVGSMDLGIRPEALNLRVVLADPTLGESVAIFTEAGDGRRIRVRTGDRIGGMTVIAIHPRRVDVVIEEFGVPRRESFYVKRADTETGTES